MDVSFTQSLWIALTVGIASGSIGAFIILKRMALVGDALSHVALPGIALMLLYNLEPFWGVILFLSGAAVVIWWLEGRGSLPPDAVVGLLFTASLAIGILAIPDHEIIESLFGEFPVLSPIQLLLVCGLATVLAILIFAFARKFLFAIISPDLARTEGIGRGYSLLLLFIFSFVVALGIKLVGTLLMGALTIIPPSVAKNLAFSMRSYLVISAVLGGIISLSGVLIANATGFLPGPTIILFGVGLFCLSLPFSKR